MKNRALVLAATVTFAELCAAEPTPIALTDALRTALQSNRRIHDGCDSVRSARYGIDVANAEFAVHLVPLATSGLGSDTETSQSSAVSVNKKFSTGTIVELGAGTASTEDDFHRSFSGVTLSQALFRDFGPLTNTARVVEASRRVGSAERQLRLTAEQVAMDVAEAFYRIVGLDSEIAILERQLERAQHHARVADARLAKALATRMEVFRAQGQEAAAENDLLDARESAESARDELDVLLGRAPGEPLAIVPEPLVVQVEEGEETLIAAALERRAEIAEAIDQAAEAELRARVAQRNIYPDLRVGVNFALVGVGPTFEQSTSLDESGVRFLVSGTNPLDWRVGRAQAEQARLELATRKREAAQIQQRVTLEVRQAVRRLATIERRIAVQERNVQASSANVELANLRFDRGYASLLDVLEAEDALAKAQRDEAALRIERILASLRVRRSSGRLEELLRTLVGDDPLGSVCS